MAITGRKITAFTKKVADLPDKTSGAYTAAQVKAQFDAAPDELRLAHNGLIDDLGATTAGDSGAHNIGSATITGVTGNTVHSQITDIKAQLSGAVAGTIPNGTITEPKLAPEVAAKLLPYGETTTNVGNAYSVTYPITALVTGFGISVQINANSTGAATLNVDGKGAKAIKKPNGLDATNLVGGSIYTLRYNGTNFILQGEGGEYGTATTGDVLTGTTFGTETGVVSGTLSLSGTTGDANVLAGQTYYNTDAKTKRTGTMPNNGILNYTPSSNVQSIPAGYTSGGTVGAGKRFAAGTANTVVSGNSISVRGLAFRPSFFLVKSGATESNFNSAYGTAVAMGTASNLNITRGNAGSSSTMTVTIYNDGFDATVDAASNAMTFNWIAFE